LIPPHRDNDPQTERKEPPIDNQSVAGPRYNGSSLPQSRCEGNSQGNCAIVPTTGLYGTV
jgi:hypothetical protein